ncbi:MAG: DUF58 domain-containing protein [Acidobacteria bacterium]|nr:DUF58 domain-containing protein [Acidobacteriota bacterium]
MPASTLLDPAFLRKLELLRIQARKAFPGTMRGERRSTRRGASVEFADFRKYEAGDDFRHVDWSIYARLERLMLRQFVEEEDVRIDILIDQSRSMHFGAPLSKFDFARRAAAALAFLAVSSLDQVGIATFDTAIRLQKRASRGRGHLLAVLNFLESLAKTEKPSSSDGVASEPTGKIAKRTPPTNQRTSLSAVLQQYQRTTVRPGIVFVLSDFLDEDDFRSPLKLLAQRKFEINLIQVLADEEVNPEIVGDILMVDAESGAEREITANPRAVAAYKKMLAQYTKALENFCKANGLGYTLVQASASFADLLLKNLIESRMAGCVG